MTAIIVVGVLLFGTVLVGLMLRGLSRRANAEMWSAGKPDAKKSTAAGLAGVMFVDGGGCGGCGGCGG